MHLMHRGEQRVELLDRSPQKLTEEKNLLVRAHVYLSREMYLMFDGISRKVQTDGRSTRRELLFEFHASLSLTLSSPRSREFGLPIVLTSQSAD